MPIHLYSWNVNGLRAAGRKGFVDWLAHSDAQIVAIQEVKATPDQLPEALRHPLGFNVDWHPASAKGYSGVATYSREPPRSVARTLGDSPSGDDGRVLISDFGRFLVFNVYAPNGGRGSAWVREKLAFYDHLLTRVILEMRSGRSVIIAGDLNTAYAAIDLARARENIHTSGFLPEERQALGAFFAAGLVDTFRARHTDEAKYSYWDPRTRARERNVGWRLDYFLISPDLVPDVQSAEIHTDVPGSDHCPISLTLCGAPCEPDRRDEYYR